MRRDKALRLAIVVVSGMAAVACGPSTPTLPVATTPQSPPTTTPTLLPTAPSSVQPRAVTSPAPTHSPTASPLPTPVATPTLRAYNGALLSAVQEPTDIQLSLRTMTQVGDGLRILAMGTPTGRDLLLATQQTAALMAQLQPQILRMTFTQRQQAFQLEQELVCGIGAVQSLYVYHRTSVGPTASRGTPTIVPGTPVVVIGTPVPLSPPLTPAQLIANELQQLQLNAVEMAAGEPDDGAVAVWLASMGSVLSTIRQLVYQLDPADLDLLSGGVARAMTAMIGAMQSYVSR